jgi:hypothetical protein
MVDRTLDMIGVDAQFGHAYHHTGSGLKVFQVISRNGVLVQSAFEFGCEPFFIYIAR